MREGSGSESAPYFSADGTAGIQEELRQKAERGGTVRLECARYDITSTVQIDTPCICLEGDVWAYNSDPNGVFETRYGTKLRMKGRDFPAISVGVTCTAEGCVIRNLGIQGDITGMDTRPLLNMTAPLSSSGLTFSHTRIDQGEFSKLSFCGLNCAVCAEGDAEIDSALFERMNLDGNAIGVYFAPRAAYYPRFVRNVIADNPYYGFYANGHDRRLFNLEIASNLFVRNGGAFTENDAMVHAAVCLEDITSCIFRDNLIRNAGIFWPFAPDATDNNMHGAVYCKTVGLFVRGDGNRLMNNIFSNSSSDAIRVCGDSNILMNNIADADVVIHGNGNIIQGMAFTSPEAKLILQGQDNLASGVPEDRIVRK